MSDVTQLLGRIDAGDPKAADQLLPLVYWELRKLARHKMAQERPGQTLQATALVHETWLRLNESNRQEWRGRQHFLSAAAEAMRRILVENARRKLRARHGGMAPTKILTRWGAQNGEECPQTNARSWQLPGHAEHRGNQI